MTAIAWAIVVVSLIFYDAIYTDVLKEKQLTHTLGNLIWLSIVILLISTFREWLR